MPTSSGVPARPGPAQGAELDHPPVALPARLAELVPRRRGDDDDGTDGPVPQARVPARGDRRSLLFTISIMLRT